MCFLFSIPRSNTLLGMTFDSEHAIKKVSELCVVTDDVACCAENTSGKEIRSAKYAVLDG